MSNNYLQNGIKLSKSALTVGDEVTLTYNGHLASQGTDLYVHLGYGDSWEDVRDVSMKKEKGGTYKATIKVTKPGGLNLCFKDKAGSQWDNNNGWNYHFDVTGKATSSKVANPKTATKPVVKTAAKTATPKAAAKPTAKPTATKPSVKKTSTSSAKTLTSKAPKAASSPKSTKTSGTPAPSTSKTTSK